MPRIRQLLYIIVDQSPKSDAPEALLVRGRWLALASPRLEPDSASSARPSAPSRVLAWMPCWSGRAATKSPMPRVEGGDLSAKPKVDEHLH